VSVVDAAGEVSALAGVDAGVVSAASIVAGVG
jgi:hypothetical protein